MSASEFYLLSETALQFLDEGKLRKEYALELNRCPVCECVSQKRLFNFDGFSYKKCSGCGFIFVNPRLNDEGSKIWYNSQFYNSSLKWEIFYNENDERYYSVSLSEKHFRKFCEIIDETFKDRSISIIDLGCSTGSLLAYLRDKLRFTNVSGADLNSKAVEFATERRKLNVSWADINELITGGKQYDLVISTENIEHVNEPGKYIKKVSELLRPGGYFAFSTPHSDEVAVRIMGKFGDHFCAPNHINYFSSKTIRTFLEKHRFVVEKIWLDTVNPISIWGFIKSKIFFPDQVASDPPHESYFSKPNGRDIRKRRAAVRQRIPSSPWVNDKSIGQDNIITSGSLLKKILQKPVGIEIKNHMIVIARKDDKER